MPTYHRLAKPFKAGFCPPSIWSSQPFWFIAFSSMGQATCCQGSGRNTFFLGNIKEGHHILLGTTYVWIYFAKKKKKKNKMIYFLWLLFCKASFFIFNFWLEGEICQLGLLCRTECLSISFVPFSFILLPRILIFHTYTYMSKRMSQYFFCTFLRPI